MTPLLLALRFGAVVGVLNLLWLYASFYIGLHTNGLVVFQVVPSVWLVITATGFVIGLRTIRRAYGPLDYWQGVRYGLIASVVTAMIAVVMQVGYFTIINPDWTRYMVEETRIHFAATGASPEEVAARVIAALDYFSLTSYATQSAVTALVGGVVVSLVVMAFLRGASSHPAAVAR